MWPNKVYSNSAITLTKPSNIILVLFHLKSCQTHRTGARTVQRTPMYLSPRDTFQILPILPLMRFIGKRSIQDHVLHIALSLISSDWEQVFSNLLDSHDLNISKISQASYFVDSPSLDLSDVSSQFHAD